ncbi:MAG: hypothetical protein ABIR24_02835 [Verrucomicrobiota bacterium]
MKKFITGIALALFALTTFFPNSAAAKPKNSKLNISQDPNTGRIIVSWTGKGVLKKASEPNGKFHPVTNTKGNQSSYVVEPGDDEKAVFRLDGAEGDVFSVNIVGYVNLRLPPGLSLIENPLYYPTNTVELWWPNAPDGSQILKYVTGEGYEVSTFDGIAKTWSNPGLEIPIGQGFYFRNLSIQTVTNTFVGEVHQGFLTNALPAGYSMKGSLVPQEGSINSVHGIPGQSGDEIHTLTNDAGVETENISTFDGALNQWIPDLILHVGEGFWIHKQNQQDWVRYFSVN